LKNPKKSEKEAKKYIWAVYTIYMFPFSGFNNANPFNPSAPTQAAGPSTASSSQQTSDDPLKSMTDKLNQVFGQQYPYWKNIRSPGQMGMSDRGTLEQLGTNIDGLINYVEVLVSGQGGASATGGPLGNKFFVPTGGKCVDINDKSCEGQGSSCTSNLKDRYIYIDNVPSGNIPFISAGLGGNFSEFRGLIPGVMSNLNVLNPVSLLGAFTAGLKPDCTSVTLETINTNNGHGQDTHYVALVDQKNMDPCSFPGGRNPASGDTCRELFTQITPAPYIQESPMVQVYYFLVSLLAIYIVFCLMKK
jgi:hypothetical protein